MSHPNILISGSGVAGGAFAFWLLRAYPNANITIIERDPSLRLTGASVDIRSSAVDIIKWMGAEQEIRKQMTNEEGMQVVDLNGKAVATLLASGSSEVQSLTSEYEIFRGALAKIFIDSIIKSVKIIFDETVDHYEQKDDGVAVTFTKSKEVKTYDLLVAADGLRSKIRGMMLNSNPQDQLHGEGIHVAYFTIKSDLLKGSKLAKGLNATGGRAIYLRPDSHPDGRTRVMLMKISLNGDTETKEKLNKTLREGNESYKKLMEEMYGDVGWVVPEVLKGMRESDDFYCSIFGHIKSPKIQDGRVVLLGDAGYATPGFGTSLAIIGGYVLAGELMTHPGDFKAALEGYEKIMLPFATSSQSGSEYAMQVFNPQTEWGIRVRNSIFWFVTWMRMDRLALAIASVLNFTEKKAPMPDYPWPENQDIVPLSF